jgi:hypothetical protein
LTVSDLPVSLVTRAVVPAWLLLILGRPEKYRPEMLMFLVLPAVTNPMTRMGLGTGVTKVTVVAADEIAVLVVEAALVAVTVHVPRLVTVSELPVTTQPPAVPTTAV